MLPEPGSGNVYICKILRLQAQVLLITRILGVVSGGTYPTHGVARILACISKGVLEKLLFNFQ
jgi:hypothetical protein